MDHSRVMDSRVNQVLIQFSHQYRTIQTIL